MFMPKLSKSGPGNWGKEFGYMWDELVPCVLLLIALGKPIRSVSGLEETVPCFSLHHRVQVLDGGLGFLQSHLRKVKEKSQRLLKSCDVNGVHTILPGLCMDHWANWAPSAYLATWLQWSHTTHTHTHTPALRWLRTNFWWWVSHLEIWMLFL